MTTNPPDPDVGAIVAADPTLIPAEAASVVRSSVAQLAQMRHKGTGPRFIKSGRKVLYRLSDLQAWLDQNTRTSTGGAA